jgi:hypothetical protein
MEEPFADPAAMTPHARRQEIAAILARDVLRLRQAGQACSVRVPLARPKIPRNRGKTALMWGEERALMCPLDSHE